MMPNAPPRIATPASLHGSDRFDRLIKVLASIARGDTDVRLPVSDEHDAWDAVAMAINFTVDEMAYRNRAVEQAYATVQRTERELRQQETVLRTLLDSVADVLLVHNARGQFVEANRTAVRQLGHTREELLTMHVRDIEVEPRELDLEVAEDLADAITLECTHRRKDGTTYPVEIRVVLLPFRDRSHFLVVARDITERRRAEAFRQAVLDRTLLSQETERQRLARELHDGPCQVLTSALMRMDAVATQVSETRQREAIVDLRRLVAEAVSELRTMSHRLRPPTLDELGLVAALERLLEDSNTPDCKCSFVATGPHASEPWTTEVATAVYRIVQESLQNIARHAEASQVSATLTVTRDRLRVAIEDDGKGFPSPRHQNSGGLGLVGMRERARSIGGGLTIESFPGEGTTVFINAPLKGAT